MQRRAFYVTHVLELDTFTHPDTGIWHPRKIQEYYVVMKMTINDGPSCECGDEDDQDDDKNVGGDEA